MAFSSLPVIFVLAFAASFAFGRETRKRGYESAKAARFPVMLGFGIMLVNLLAVLLWMRIFGDSGDRAQLGEMVCIVTDIFFTALFVAWISKNWKAIRTLPDRARSTGASR
ncbi:MAG: hypothetical protein JWO82_3244 [Akkermansiaceae bacterium]|nr:hypothetical protein [Akkermansiaceae bacterium]